MPAPTSPAPGCAPKCRIAFAAREATRPAKGFFAGRRQACHAALDICGRLRRDPPDFPPEPSRARKPRQLQAWSHRRTATRTLMRRRGAPPCLAPNPSFPLGSRSRSKVHWRRARHQGCPAPSSRCPQRLVSRMRLCCSLSEWSKPGISGFQKINAASGLSRDG